MTKLELQSLATFRHDKSPASPNCVAPGRLCCARQSNQRCPPAVNRTAPASRLRRARAKTIRTARRSNRAPGHPSFAAPSPCPRFGRAGRRLSQACLPTLSSVCAARFFLASRFSRTVRAASISCCGMSSLRLVLTGLPLHSTRNPVEALAPRRWIADDGAGPRIGPVESPDAPDQFGIGARWCGVRRYTPPGFALVRHGQNVSGPRTAHAR